MVCEDEDLGDAEPFSELRIDSIENRTKWWLNSLNQRCRTEVELLLCIDI